MREKNRRLNFRVSAETLGTINYVLKKSREKNSEISKTAILEKAIEKYAIEILNEEPVVHDFNTLVELLPKTIQKTLEHTFEKLEYEINQLNEKIEVYNETQTQYLILIIKLLAEMNSNVYDNLQNEIKIDNILNHTMTNLLKMKVNEFTSNTLFEKKFIQDEDDYL